MPLDAYGVLKGRPIGRQLASGAKPHYQIHIVDDTAHYRIAVNVTSQWRRLSFSFLDHNVLNRP